MKKWGFYVGIVIFALFLLSGTFALLLHSNFARNTIASYLKEALQESGWSVSAETTEGVLTKTVRLQEVSIRSKSGTLISAHEISFELSLIRLLSREVAFKTLRIDRLRWEGRDGEEKPLDLDLPFALRINDLVLTDVRIPPGTGVSAKGSLFLGRHAKRGSADLAIRRDDLPNAKAAARLKLLPNRQLLVKINLSLPSQDALLPWIDSPLEGSASADLLAKGPFDAYLAWIQTKRPSSSIQGWIRLSADIARTPFPEIADRAASRAWTLAASCLAGTDGTFHFSNIRLEAKHIQIQGAVSFEERFRRISASLLRARTESLSSLTGLPLDGAFACDWDSQGNEGTLALRSPQARARNFLFENLSARLKGGEESGEWAALLDLSATLQGKPATLSCNLLWTKGSPLSVQDIALSSPWINAEGALAFNSPSLADGSLSVESPHLDAWKTFYPDWPLYGRASGAIAFHDGVVAIQASSPGLSYKTASIEALSLSSEGNNLSLSLTGVQRGNFLAETIRLTVDEGRFQANASGDWKGPFSMHADGTAQFEFPTLSLNIQDLYGFLFSTPLALSRPADLAIGSEGIRLPELECSLGNAAILARIIYEKDHADLRLLLDRFPLSFFSANPLDLSLAGLLQLNAELEQTGERVAGSLHAFIANAEIKGIGEETPLSAQGTIDAKFQHSRLNGSFQFSIREQPVLIGSLNAPLDLSLSPPRLEFPLDQPAEGSLSYQGAAEDLLDFFDLGANRLEGAVRCALAFRGTLGLPRISGSCLFEHGTYENYFTGTRLGNIRAEIAGSGSALQLRSLQAEDPLNKGRLSLSGEWNLVAEERLPFSFSGSFSRLEVTDINWVKTEAGGSIHITGNRDLAKISGEAVVLESDMEIPEQLPPRLPNLPVKYINASRPVAVEQAPTSPAYPVFFNYHIYAPDGVFVTGRGLSSEWKGDIQVGGTYSDIETKGKLELMAGQFDFSGRSLKLTEGSLLFSGRPRELPVINIAAQLDLSNVRIIARLKGFLNAPQLSFQSIPSLPMGSILSYLLFGQDLSDVTAIQAAQIVNSISTLSGKGPNWFEQTKNTLGVDRLRIVATPLGDEGGSTYSLQVGKYVTRGILVSVSQGFTLGGNYLGSPNVAIEVDLARGFSFEAESQSEQQQGKFTLKWSKSY